MRAPAAILRPRYFGSSRLFSFRGRAGSSAGLGLLAVIVGFGSRRVGGGGGGVEYISGIRPRIVMEASEQAKPAHDLTPP